VPIISGGDGSNEHPMQALVDVTILRRGGLENATIAIVGNLKSHRTTHSLALALRRFGGRIVLISPPGLEMPRHYIDGAVQQLSLSQADDLNEVLSTVDVVYMVPLSYYDGLQDDVHGAYRFNLRRAEHVLRRGAKIMHPFPCFDELSNDLDGSTFNLYHSQASVGPAVRSRVLSYLIG
jgi:aspartate carbamoyltransferase catalytic subunit